MTAKKFSNRENDLLQVLCDVASVNGLLIQRLNKKDDVVDELAMARAAEALCLHTLEENNWGNSQ